MAGINEIAELKKKIVLAVYKAGEGHIASAFSILDILYVLHKQVLGPDDKFILSKGHGCLALYAVLGLDMLDFCQYDSKLGGHPDRNKLPAVVASTGSLGHGLPMAVGLALARKIKGTGRVFCLVGDGECNEGTIWESALIAAHHKLDNLTVIVDKNRSNDRAVDMTRLAAKFDSFNFGTLEIDGHDHKTIKWALEVGNLGLPCAIIAKTIKGYGVRKMENNPEWHHKVPTNQQELNEILAELV